MFQGNWVCGKCGGAITELPFQPRSSAGLTCRTCYFNDRPGNNSPDQSGTPDEARPQLESVLDTRDDIPDFDPDAVGAASEPAPEPPEFADAPVTTGEKPKFEGDWQCGTCGAAITSLPFKPRSIENLKCLDCFKASKG